MKLIIILPILILVFYDPFCLCLENCFIDFGMSLLAGNDITRSKIKGSNKECSDWCISFPNCKGWTRQKRSGWCFLKNTTAFSESHKDWDKGSRCTKTGLF